MFTILSHTNDVSLRIVSKNRQDLFKDSLRALAEVLKKNSSTSSGTQVVAQIEIRSLNESSLLIDFLSRALSLSYDKKAIFMDVKFVLFEKNLCVASLVGKKTDKFDRNVKSVTHREADISISPAGEYETNIILSV